MHPLIKFAAKLLPRSLKQRLKDSLARYYKAPSMELSLKNIRQLGFNPASIIDVGAYVGEWSLMAHEIFPDASVLMLEAQRAKAPALDAIAKGHPGKIHYRIVLLGPENRADVVFHECDTAPTAASVLQGREPLPFNDVVRRMQTLDGVLAEAGIDKPDFLKLDVQGYEIKVLEGGRNALSSAHVVLMEVSTIELYEEAPLLHDVVAFMHTHGYHVFDISSLMRLRTDDTLIQLDVLFVKSDSFLFSKAIGKL